MKALHIFIILSWTAWAWGETRAHGVLSRSSQFIVHGPSGIPRYAPSEGEPKSNIVRLEADLLAVSAERVKGALLKELKLADRYRGRIHLVLHERKASQQPIIIISTQYQDGWQFQVEIPDRIEDFKLMEGMVQVLLLELITRNSASHTPDLPAWLIQGLAEHLMATASSPCILQRDIRTVREVVRPDSFRAAREFLRTNAPLTFTELSLPPPGPQPEYQEQTGRYSAQIFVAALLQTRGGRARLLTMMQALPRCWNWQTAFFGAYAPQFQRMLDVEKWWSLFLVDFLGRDQRQTWSRAASLQKLDEILISPAQVRLASNTLPARIQVPLQEILRKWDLANQRAVLSHKISQLAIVGFSLWPECGRLADRYRNLLESYLQDRERIVYAPSLKIAPALRAGFVIQNAIKQLDHLDAERESVRRGGITTANGPISPTR